MISLTLTGIAEVTQQLQRLVTAPLPAVGEALYEEGNRIMGQSVQLVPVDTGLLRSTAHVERPVTTGARVEVELSYGSEGTAPYAARIEFDITLNHPHGGQAHYLQQPLFAATNGFAQRIAAALQGQLA
jgi:hypothetical protein